MAMNSSVTSEPLNLGVVVIGRNEEARLAACLRAAVSAVADLSRTKILYVDAGSCDRSREIARSVSGVECLELGPARAARARNAGWRALQAEFILFLDGDMVLIPKFLELALCAVRAGQTAAVTGFIVEEEKGASLASRLFGRDWSRAVGEVPAVGGAALWRRSDLAAVSGFDEELSVGEDPDLSLRVRARGRRLIQIETPMVWHRLDLRGWRDWWRRGVSVGLSSALVAARHPNADMPRERLRRARRDVFLAALVLLSAGLAAMGGSSAAGVAILSVALVAFISKLVGIISRDPRLSSDYGPRLAHALHGQCIKLPLLFGAISARRHQAFPRRQS
jgi:GT2 family glycosyltransferase